MSGPAAGLADLHTHTARCGHAGGSDEEYIETAIARGLSAIAVTDHVPFYWLPAEQHDARLAMSGDELPRYVDVVLGMRERYAGRVEVLLGLEADFIAGHEESLARLLERHPFDVVLGSVHWVGDWLVDAPSALPRFRQGSAEVERIWEEYTTELIAAARSGLFDVLSHLDLPKKFGFRSQATFAGRLGEVVAAVTAGGCAVELSSAGRRKPVGEDYPADDVVAALAAAGVRFVLCSDAHAPAEVGFGFAELAARARAHGAVATALFRGRTATMLPLP